MLAHWAKWAQMAVRRVGVFATGIMNSHFFVTGQITPNFTFIGATTRV